MRDINLYQQKFKKYTCICFYWWRKKNKYLCSLPEGFLQQNLCEGPWPDFVSDEALNRFFAVGWVEYQKNKEVYYFVVRWLLHRVHRLSNTISCVTCKSRFMSTYSICTCIYVLFVPFPSTFTCTCICVLHVQFQKTLYFFFIVNNYYQNQIYASNKQSSNKLQVVFKTVISILL